MGGVKLQQCRGGGGGGYSGWACSPVAVQPLVGTVIISILDSCLLPLLTRCPPHPSVPRTPPCPIQARRCMCRGAGRCRQHLHILLLLGQVILQLHHFLLLLRPGWLLLLACLCKALLQPGWTSRLVLAVVIEGAGLGLRSGVELRLLFSTGG